MMILEEAEFRRWKEHPLTQEFLGLLRQRRDKLALAWARGILGSDSLQAQAEAITLDLLAGIDFDGLQQLAGVEETGADRIVDDD